MCRLCGPSAGRERTAAAFWLLDADDSLSRQSPATPDGTGLGRFAESGAPHVEKQAIAAFDDPGVRGHVDTDLTAHRSCHRRPRHHHTHRPARRSSAS